MEAIQKSVDDLSQIFHKTMADFQQNLQSAIPATSPTSNIAAQFSSFRNFVMAALKSLQGQVEILSQQMDQQEARSRRKIILLHGVPEIEREDLSITVVNAIKQHLEVPEFSAASISRCHRIGKPNSERPRTLLVKFHELTVRNKIWFSKKKFKATGVTLAEFLTKNRHEIFMAARQQLGIAKTWTRNGQVIVVGPDGKRHAINSKTELNSISGGKDSESTVNAPAGSTALAPTQQTGYSQRPKRQAAKK